MEEKQLSLITKANKSKIRPNLLFLDNLGNLAYIDESNKKHLVLNLSSEDRPIYSSELFNKLNDRSWNNPVKKEIVDDELVILNKNTGNEIDYSTGIYSFSNFNYTKNKLPVDNLEIMDFMKNIYNNINKNELTLYNSSKIVVNILEGSVTFNLIDPDIYTDTVDLSRLDQKTTKARTSGKVDITVKYSINESVYSETTTFNAFKYTIDKDGLPILEKFNQIFKLGNVSLEYIEGVAKVVPISENIEECIISNCTVTYGNI